MSTNEEYKSKENASLYFYAPLLTAGKYYQLLIHTVAINKNE